MKKIIYTFLACGVLGLSSCESFLDVQPKGTVEQDKQFSDVQGYRDAMYGVYASMGSTSLYGEALTWGFVDWLAQLEYDVYGSYQDVAHANLYEYEDQNVRPIVDAIWGDAYECISYVNNVLTNIENVDLESDGDYKLIKGEALAIRAFLHFDIARLFAENYLLNPGAGGIPYATTYNLNNKPVLTLADTYEAILADLTEAEALLAEDTEMDPAEPASDYREHRWMHCNKYAAWAIKARVFHYMGQLDSAAVYAEKVIESPGMELVAKGTYTSKKAHRFSLATTNGEVIWGLYTKGYYDSYRDLHVDGSILMGALLSVRLDVREIYDVGNFDADSRDERFTCYFKTDDYDGSLYNFKRLLEASEDANRIYGVCLIRLPEMYYIMAEALYATDKTRAVRYLNDVRNSRGLRDLADTEVATETQFRNEVLNERVKELWGEGQVFLTYKRENMSITEGPGELVYEPSTDIYVLPWPENEKEYGGTSKN